MSTYLYNAFDCMFLSCQVRVSPGASCRFSLKRVRDMVRPYCTPFVHCLFRRLKSRYQSLKLWHCELNLIQNFPKQKKTVFTVKASLMTPCPSAPVRYAPVASPVNKFPETVSSFPKYPSQVNKWKSFSTQS